MNPIATTAFSLVLIFSASASHAQDIQSPSRLDIPVSTAVEPPVLSENQVQVEVEIEAEGGVGAGTQIPDEKPTIPVVLGPTYEAPVPNDDETLVPLASFPMTDVQFRLKKGRVRLKYNLPLELTGGVAKELTFFSEEAPTEVPFEVLSGDGKGLCELDAETRTTYSCSMDYIPSKLNLDPVLIDGYLQETISDPMDLLNMQALGKHFFNEARGVVKGLTLRKR